MLRKYVIQYLDSYRYSWENMQSFDADIVDVEQSLPSLYDKLKQYKNEAIQEGDHDASYRLVLITEQILRD